MVVVVVPRVVVVVGLCLDCCAEFYRNIRGLYLLGHQMKVFYKHFIFLN